jgi:hypothetical protein
MQHLEIDPHSYATKQRDHCISLECRQFPKQIQLSSNKSMWRLLNKSSNTKYVSVLFIELFIRSINASFLDNKV